MKRLILFDIDGTLLVCGPQVRPIFIAALEEVYGVAGPLEGFEFSGKTDPQIVFELQRRAGLDATTILDGLPRMREVYSASLAEKLDHRRMVMLPGVEALLEDLSARDDISLALLTGNWQPCAATKLSRFHLDAFFSFGAFGDDAVERRKLVPIALDRAERHYDERFAPQQTLIVGDSVLDVDCAQASGVPSLAVATGFTSPEALTRSGADWVYENLEQAVECDFFAPVSIADDLNPTR